MTEIRYNPYRNRRVGFYGDHWQLNVDRSWDYESGIPITKAKYIDIKETIAAWGVTT